MEGGGGNSRKKTGPWKGLVGRDIRWGLLIWPGSGCSDPQHAFNKCLWVSGG